MEIDRRGGVVWIWHAYEHLDLNHYRIQQAKCLLRENSRNITEVMMAVGFSDSSYFNHVFRREVGVSPSEYQRGKK